MERSFTLRVAMTKGNMGYVYKRLGHLARTRSLFEEVHNIFTQSLGPDHPNTKQTAGDLAQLSG